MGRVHLDRQKTHYLLTAQAKIPTKLRAGAAVRGATRTHSFAGTSLLQTFDLIKRLRKWGCCVHPPIVKTIDNQTAESNLQ